MQSDVLRCASGHTAAATQTEDNRENLFQPIKRLTRHQDRRLRVRSGSNRSARGRLQEPLRRNCWGMVGFRPM